MTTLKDLKGTWSELPAIWALISAGQASQHDRGHHVPIHSARLQQDDLLDFHGASTRAHVRGIMPALYIRLNANQAHSHISTLPLSNFW